MTDRLSEIAARPFRSLDDLTAAVLEVVREALDLQTPFVARTDHGRFEVVAVGSARGGLLAVGDTLPLLDSY